MTIYFDMDGTISNLYAVENWLSKLRAEDASPYMEAEPLCDMKLLQSKLIQAQYLGYKVGIISWCSKAATKEYNSAVRKAKKEWLKAQLPKVKFDEIHIVAYGKPKNKVANDKGWLIDDEQQNRDNWNLGGAYNPTVVDVLEILDEILGEI